ncbi:hypothetical protein RhiirA4_482498 [Rhizophagus irregularis]|uniref:HAT C-terminal dimerisation domain-containing protein n=1 Tax=Rhizophagus irregularis TaxID=588596 RepID=A0A2I1HL58_9GLOM|nr:hypothetical protein RhiirA4_482498 [Rhizophagus irregularis]
MFQNFIDNKQQELLQKQQKITDKDVNEKENEINCFNPITSRYLSEGEIAKKKKAKVDYEGTQRKVSKPSKYSKELFGNPSVLLERVFSSTADVVTSDRAHFTPEIIRAIMCLKYWYHSGILN